MIVLLLTGEKDQGKTATLKLLYNKYFEKQADKIIEFEIIGADGNDFSVLLDYNGKIIAIHTVGDEAKYVIDAFEYYSTFKVNHKELKIDLLILGHRKRICLPKGIPIASYLPEFPNTHQVVDYYNVELISKVVKQGFSILDTNNITDKEKNDCNNSDKEYAEKLFNIVYKLLNSNI